MIPKSMSLGFDPMGGNRFFGKDHAQAKRHKQLENSALAGHGTIMAHGDRAPLRG
jgi:hypothetical protein